MKKLLIGFFIFFQWASVAFASVDDVHAYLRVLDAWCMANADSYAQIDKMAKAANLLKMPQRINQGDPVLASHGGVSYGLIDGDRRYLIAYANHGGCTVATSSLNIEELKKLLSTNYSIKKIDSDNEGIQAKELYAFDVSSKYHGGLLILTYYKDAGTFSMTSIGFMPKRFVPDGIHIETRND